MVLQKSQFSLTGQLVIITGASSGIGQQCAISCSQMGATVVLLGRNQNRLNRTLELTSKPEKHLKYSVDLLDYKSVKEIIQDVVDIKGTIHGLINCAGISTTLPINSITFEKMELFFRTNVIGAINLTKEVVRKANFSDVGGSIIFLSSIMGVAGESGKTLYAMTKGALVAAVKSMSIELAPRNIRINSILPGVVESPMSEKSIYYKNEESLKNIRSLHPLGLGKPEYIANACIFMLSEAARWITGTNLIVDGGYLAR